MKPKQPKAEPETAVDDVRRVRNELHNRFGGDFRKLAAHANKVAADHRDRLGLKVVEPRPRQARRDGTTG